MKPLSLTSVLWIVFPLVVLLSTTEITLDPVMTTRTITWALGLGVVALVSMISYKE